MTSRLSWLATAAIAALASCTTAHADAAPVFKPKLAFRAYAAKQLHLPVGEIRGGADDAGTAAQHSLGGAWRYWVWPRADRNHTVRGWITADAAVITRDQNLGRLFAEAGVWSHPQNPAQLAAQLADEIAWSFGLDRVVPDSDDGKPTPPVLTLAANGTGSLHYIGEHNSAWGTGRYRIDIALTAGHKATLTRTALTPPPREQPQRPLTVVAPAPDTADKAAFRAYAARVVSAPGDELDDSPDDITANKSRGSLRAFAMRYESDRLHEVRGWASGPTAVSPRENLGLLFEQAGLWSAPAKPSKLDALAQQLADDITWAYGGDHQVTGDPKLTLAADGSGTLRFFTVSQESYDDPAPPPAGSSAGPIGGGGVRAIVNYQTVVAFTAGHKATLTRTPASP